MRRKNQRVLLLAPPLLCFILYLVLPVRIFSFVPEPIYCGPHNFQSDYGESITVCNLGGLDAQPTYFKISMSFVLEERPTSGSARIFSTSTATNGLSLDVDFMGTLYLRIGSSTDPLRPYGDGSQLVKASDPFDTGKRMAVEIIYRKVTNQFSLQVAGEDRALFQNEDGKSAYDPRRITPDLSYIQLGGPRGTSFAGTIQDFSVSSSLEDSRGTTRELKATLLILGVSLTFTSCIYFFSTRKEEVISD